MPPIVDLVAPYQTADQRLQQYRHRLHHRTRSTPTWHFTQETNGANLQADASVWKLESEGIPVDFHLSGAMTNRLIASTATPETPYELKVSDMFSAMPYENSLVVMRDEWPAAQGCS